MLPLTSSPVNLLELRTRNEEHIVCSGISSDGQWIAYCDRNTLRLFNLNLVRDMTCILIFVMVLLVHIFNSEKLLSY